MTSEQQSSRRRASSSPPAPLRHFERSVAAGTAPVMLAYAARGLSNPRIPGSLLQSLVRSMASVELVSPSPTVVAATKASEESPASSVSPLTASGTPPAAACATSSRPEATVRAELEAAKTQIQLLNKVNEQMLRQYNALEADNTRLQEAYDSVFAENESLKHRLAKQQEEIDEQFHMICKLQRDVPDKC